MNRGKVIDILKKDNTWQVIPSGKNAVKAVKQFGRQRPKIIELTLNCVSEGIYIEHPNYEFKSTVSHFISVQKDIRLSLNKTFLGSIIKALKRVGLWEAVVNKDFLRVNTNNSKSNKNYVKKELKFLLK